MVNKFYGLAILFLLFGSVTTLAGDLNSDTQVTGRLSYDKKEGKPKVFIEGIWLDFDFMRRNMKFVDFVNDPAVADVHIIINQRVNGGGGLVYSLMYNTKTFENFNDFTLTCTTTPGDTHDERRKIITDAISKGLMPFANQTEIANKLSIRYSGKGDVKNIPIDDPWNNWTFRGDFNGNINI